MEKQQHTIVNIDKLMGKTSNSTSSLQGLGNLANMRQYPLTSQNAMPPRWHEDQVKRYQEKINKLLENAKYKEGDKVYYYKRYYFTKREYNALAGMNAIPVKEEIIVDEKDLTIGTVQRLYVSGEQLGYYIDNNPYHEDAIKCIVTKVKKKKLNL